MERSLTRVLRLRALLEDVSRIELEAQLQELTRIEGALAESEKAGTAMRQRIFLGIAQGQNGDRAEIGLLSEWIAWERRLYEKKRRSKAVTVDASKAEYLERRKEHGQIRSVIEARMSAAAIESRRREQRELDDWFSRQGRHERSHKSNSMRFF